MRFFSKHVKAIFIMVGFVLLSGLLLRSQSGNQRVDNFLKSLSTFPNADVAKTAAEAARFTEAEKEQLKRAIRNPLYTSQVARLVGTIEKKPLATRPSKRDTINRQQEQTRRIEGVNQSLRSEAQRLQTMSAQLSAAAKSVLGTPPKITSLSQLTIEPAQDLIIHGTNLLPQGSVSFTFGSQSFNPSKIWNWTNDFIHLTFPYNVSGLGEMDGNVTVRKQNSMMRADSPIHFVPIWEYRTLRSNAMTYDSLPYDQALALIFFLITPIRSWCSTYGMSFPDVPMSRLLNGWEIQSLNYESAVAIRLQDEDPMYYVEWDSLPTETEGEICHGLFDPGNIYCVVIIKGPRGVPYK